MMLTKIWLIIILSTVTITSFASVKAEPAEHWGILIGISDYEPIGPGGPDLQYADDDANDMYQVLTSEHGWKKENIIKLVDSAATKTSIQNAIDNLSNKVEPNDLFLLFYAGHGSYTADQPPIDEADGFDEYFLTHDLEAILDDELAIMLEKIKSKQVVVIIDACFSGGFFKVADIEARTVPGKPHEKLIDTINGDLAKQGYVVLTASDEDETCAESSTLQNGVFTYYLLEGMSSKPFPADLNNNQKVSAEEAYVYAAPRATNFNPHQHAQLWDAIPGEAELTILPRIIIGGTLMPLNKTRIIQSYLGLVLISGILSITFYKYRKIRK
jgi:uncharacterized caspase-like protein